MKQFVTGCGKTVPVSKDPSEGYVTATGAQQACDQMRGDTNMPTLLIAQTHKQAKELCRNCPKCGPVAPHLEVVIGAEQATVHQLAPGQSFQAAYVPEQATPVEVVPHAPPAAPEEQTARQALDEASYGCDVADEVEGGALNGLVPDWMREMAQATGPTSTAQPAQPAASVPPAPPLPPEPASPLLQAPAAPLPAPGPGMQGRVTSETVLVGRTFQPPAPPAPEMPLHDDQAKTTEVAAVTPPTPPAELPPAPAPAAQPAVQVHGQWAATRTPEPAAPSNGSGEQPAWLAAMMQAAGAAPAAAPQPDEVADITRAGLDLSKQTQAVLDGLTPREREVLAMRPGMPPAPAPTTAPTTPEPAQAAPEPTPTELPPPPPPPEPEPAPAPAGFSAAATHPGAVPLLMTLVEAQGVNTGPSVMGSSTLRAFQTCMRAGFYQIMKGIHRRRQTERVDDRGYAKFNPLDLGTLVHQVLARFYEGDENPFAFLADIAPHYPNIVEETRRLCTLHFNAYAERDRQIFDVRFVELESRYHFKKKRVKSYGKNLSLCISSKHDLGFRKKRSDEPRLPPGVEASGITIMDHKCLVSGEKLWSPSGRFAVDDCSVEDRHVPTIDLERGAVAWANAAFADNGEQCCVGITTKSGRELRVTDNHPVWTARGWVEAGELSTRDWVAVAPMATPASATHLSNALLEAVGYLIGDGSLIYQIALTSSREALHARYRACLDELGYAYRTTDPDDRCAGTHSGREAAPVFWRCLEELGLLGHRAATKFIPQYVLNASEEQLCVFLAALWSTDGSVGSQPEHRSENDLRICYSTRSGQLARDVQQALWRLGIWATRRNYPVKYKGERRAYWQVTVAGATSKLRFATLLADKIVYRGLMTSVLLRDLARAQPFGKQGDPDLIPADLADGYASGNASITRARLQTLQPNNPASRNPLRWDRIEKLDYFRAPTISITVSDNPVFASEDGIVSHNTIGAMTQDAQEAYRHDPQILTNTLAYERGNRVERDGSLGEPSAAVYGPLSHYAINLIGKAFHHDSTKHLVRLTQIVPRDLIDGYADDIQHWLYTELAERMFHPAAQDDETWPKSYLCRDPATGRPCPYVELCERGGLKRVDPTINYAVGAPYDPQRLIRPEVAKKGRRPKAKAAAEVERK